MNTICMYFKSGIGNLIMTTPAMQSLASMESDNKIDVCLDATWTQDERIPAIKDILNSLPFVRQVLKYPGDDISKYEKWFFPVQCAPSELTKEVMTKTKQRWPSPGWREIFIHETEVNMQTARSLGYNKPMIPPKYMSLAEGPTLEFKKPIIGLSNGAFRAPMWVKKHWPHFAMLSDTLRLYFNASVIGIGGQGELDGVTLEYNYCGKLSITESAKAISQLDLFITTDTGCMHIADALDISIIALYGSTLASKTAPLGKKTKVLKPFLSCAPCQYEERFHSCQHAGCMEAITVGEVVYWAERMLKKYGQKSTV